MISNISLHFLDAMCLILFHEYNYLLNAYMSATLDVAMSQVFINRHSTDIVGIAGMVGIVQT